MLKTPLHAVHVAAGARMVPFSGFEMPVSYRDITSEHHAVRQRAGLFDLSHMGRVRFHGPERDEVARRAQSFEVEKLPVGRTRYALVCTESGGIQDDVLVSREENALLIVVNAGNRQADLEWFRECASDLDAIVQDDSDAFAMIAVQGPEAEGILTSLGFEEAAPLKYYKHVAFPSDFGRLTLSRTGYTGEDGFEIIVPAERAADLWGRLLEVGADRGLVPCGLGARDTLRLEAGMPLHGHEISESVNPYEAGLGFAVRSKADFRGRAALERIKAEGPARRLVGLHAEGPRIPREGCPVLHEGEEVGRVCSGTRSPTLERNIATALVRADAAESGGPFTIQIRRAEVPASLVEMPFYRREKES